MTLNNRSYDLKGEYEDLEYRLMHRPDSPLFKNSIDTFPERILYL